MNTDQSASLKRSAAKIGGVLIPVLVAIVTDPVLRDQVMHFVASAKGIIAEATGLIAVIGALWKSHLEHA